MANTGKRTLRKTMIAVTTFTLGGIALLWSQLAYVLFLIETCRWTADVAPLFATCAR